MIKNYFKLIIALFYTFNSFGQSDWTLYNTTNSGIADNNITSIAIDAQGNKWVGTQNGLSKFDGVNWTTFNMSNSQIPSNSINSVAIDSKGNKWIGTNNGLAKFDNINWITYSLPNSNTNDIYSNVIRSIAIDSKDNKWITSNLYLYKFNETVQISFVNYKVNNDGYLYPVYPCVAIDKNDVIWVGAGLHGLSKIEGNNQTFFNNVSEGGGFGISSIYIDSKNNIWINGYKSGPISYIFDEKTASKIKMYDKIFCALDEKGNSWFLKDGLAKFDGQNWTNYNSLNSGISGNDIKSLVLDVEGNKWLVTNNGLQKLASDGISTLCNNLSTAVTYKNKARCKGNSFGVLTSIEKKPSYTYIWKDANNNLLSPKNSDSLIVTSNGNYNLKVQDNVCFKSTELNIEIHDTFPESKQICMVTNQNGHNLVIWENADNNFISKYRIYKQNHTTSHYELAHEQSKHEVSEWLDILSANQVERYKLIVMDSCGSESPLSENHTVILLSSNVGLNGTVNLAWNPYEGFNYQNFEIWRSTDGVNFNLLSNVANNTYAYIDNNPPSIAYYQVRITKLNGCVPSAKSITSVNSNIINKDGKSLGIKSIENEKITIYPNPTKGTVTLNSSVSMLGKSFDIVDITGRVVFKSSINTISQVINIESFERGTYFIKSTDSNSIKLIKE
jgi:hypothetical protein